MYFAQLWVSCFPFLSFRSKRVVKSRARKSSRAEATRGDGGASDGGDDGDGNNRRHFVRSLHRKQARYSVQRRDSRPSRKKKSGFLAKPWTDFALARLSFSSSSSSFFHTPVPRVTFFSLVPRRAAVRAASSVDDWDSAGRSTQNHSQDPQQHEEELES